MTNWFPTKQPYRVRIIYPTSAYDLYGWRDETYTFATEQDARNHINTLPHYKGRVEVQLAVAVNPETWERDGKWRKLLVERR